VAEFVNATAARELLGGLDQGLFYELAGRGVIPSMVVGSKRRVYPRAFFVALARYVATNPGVSLADIDPRAVMAEAAA
jgi:hypothetical protein